MKLNDILNEERVRCLGADKNAYVNSINNNQAKQKGVNVQTADKVIFPEPYENARHYYNKSNFNSQQDVNKTEEKTKNNSVNNAPMFDIKSILPMLMGGNFNNMLSPLMSMLGGGKGGNNFDVAKIFEIFKPKSKQKKDCNNEEEMSSKFDDFVIIDE
ncbi:MAG: hypothetical protein ACLRFE_00215 [Clostridia bacterium]